MRVCEFFYLCIRTFVHTNTSLAHFSVHSRSHTNTIQTKNAKKCIASFKYDDITNSKQTRYILPPSLPSMLPTKTHVMSTKPHSLSPSFCSSLSKTGHTNTKISHKISTKQKKNDHRMENWMLFYQNGGMICSLKRRRKKRNSFLFIYVCDGKKQKDGNATQQQEQQEYCQVEPCALQRELILICTVIKCRQVLFILLIRSSLIGACMVVFILVAVRCLSFSAPLCMYVFV